MRPGTPISAAALAALVAVLTPGLFAAFPHRIAVAAELAPDNQVQAIAVAASDFGSRSVALGKGKSVVIDFPRDIKDVLVGNPRIANAVIRSSRRATRFAAGSRPRRRASTGLRSAPNTLSS